MVITAAVLAALALSGSAGVKAVVRARRAQASPATPVPAPAAATATGASPPVTVVRFGGAAAPAGEPPRPVYQVGDTGLRPGANPGADEATRAAQVLHSLTRPATPPAGPTNSGIVPPRPALPPVPLTTTAPLPRSSAADVRDPSAPATPLPPTNVGIVPPLASTPAPALPSRSGGGADTSMQGPAAPLSDPAGELGGLYDPYLDQ